MDPVRNGQRTPARPGVASTGWKLQREIILLAAWAPAILLQLAHPLVARGIADHSTFRDGRRLQRLYHTIQAMLALSFGTEEQARTAAARITAIHDRVNGTLPGPAGTFAPGTAYSAHDPALLAWVHATLLSMNMRVYELYVGPLSAEEKDRYCAEATSIESYLGIPSGRLPRSAGELERYMDTMFSTRLIAVTDTARSLAHSIVHPPAPRVARPMLAFIRLVTIGLLPPTIREDYGFAWSPRRQAILRASARLIRTILPLTPPILRYWPAARRAAAAASGPTALATTDA
jgi:uncharacterized protein (DUF2236 family)